MSGILGYVLGMHDNDSYALHQEPHTSYCPCGVIVNKWETIPKNLRINKRSFDLSTTYDGFYVVSTKFKQIYSKYNFSGLVFKELPMDSDFNYVLAEKSVRFDYEKRETRFHVKCEYCTNYAEVAGAIPVYLIDNSEIPKDEFVRSDIEFGSYFEKSPLLMCGVNVGEVLNNENLKGLYLEEINPA